MHSLAVFYNICSSKLVQLVFLRRVSHNLKSEFKMPKEVKHTSALQKQRQEKRLKEKNQKYAPGTVCVKVLGSGAKGAARSLYVFTDQSRYLFNCGEGTQRLAHEHKMKLSKLEHIFITHNSWDNIGGLPGVALTIQDVGVPEVTLHGPSGTNEIFNATRRFVILRDLKVKMADCDPSKVFEDNVMKITYVPIKPGLSNINDKSSKLNEDSGINNISSTFEQTVEDDVDYYAHERKNKISSEQDTQKRKKTENESQPIIKNTKAAMCYVCNLHPRPGTLCLEKCVDKGVPPGPLLGKLKAGEDVTLPNGTVVHSSDVRLPDDPGPIFIVVECPTTDHLENLLNNPTISKHQACATKEEDVASLIVHFTPPCVLNDPKYKKWMESFSYHTQHLILNEENQCMGSVAVHRAQYKLNLLHPGLFPILGDQSIKIDKNFALVDALKDGDENKPGSTADTENLGVCGYRGRTFDSVHLRPKKLWDKQEELLLCPKQFIDEVYEADEFSETLGKLKENIETVSRDVKPKVPDPKITFLGTGSCIPNKTRNTSGILLHISDTEFILMDCGEGTFGQIVRLFGPEKADDILMGIKGIYISHLHADHHIGLIGLLKARRKAVEKNSASDTVRPVFLLAPHQIMSWLSVYHWNFEPVTQEILLVPNSQLDYDNHTINQEFEKRFLIELNMGAINTVRVKHCPNAFGVAFIHENGWKLTYSGDTMPCPQLVKLGYNSDVLIHEATMEDELEEEARLKLHSTTSQAIEVGKEMQAKFILLTHFSQRYAKIPKINENFSSNVGIAFDNMQVHFSELPLLPLMHSALKIMFADHYDEMEQKTYRRRKRQEREKEIERYQNLKEEVV